MSLNYRSNDAVRPTSLYRALRWSWSFSLRDKHVTGLAKIKARCSVVVSVEAIKDTVMATPSCLTEV